MLHEFFFSSVLERQPKIGCYRLPTHRRGAQRNFFFIIPSLFKNRKFWLTYTIVTAMQQRVNFDFLINHLPTNSLIIICPAIPANLFSIPIILIDSHNSIWISTFFLIYNILLDLQYSSWFTIFFLIYNILLDLQYSSWFTIFFLIYNILFYLIPFFLIYNIISDLQFSSRFTVDL